MTDVLAPLSGSIVIVHVEPDHVVAAGDPVAVIEAFKMMTDVEAPCAGTVRRVHVSPGQVVAEGDVIAEIEEA